MTDEGWYAPNRRPLPRRVLPCFSPFTALCHYARQQLRWLTTLRPGWERVVTLANEGETQWHSISTLASPLFPSSLFSVGFAVTRSSPLICGLWWLQTQAHIETLMFFINILMRSGFIFSLALCRHLQLKFSAHHNTNASNINPFLLNFQNYLW